MLNSLFFHPKKKRKKKKKTLQTDNALSCQNGSTPFACWPRSLASCGLHSGSASYGPRLQSAKVHEASDLLTSVFWKSSQLGKTRAACVTFYYGCCSGTRPVHEQKEKGGKRWKKKKTFLVSWKSRVTGNKDIIKSATVTRLRRNERLHRRVLLCRHCWHGSSNIISVPWDQELVWRRNMSEPLETAPAGRSRACGIREAQSRGSVERSKRQFLIAQHRRSGRKNRRKLVQDDEANCLFGGKANKTLTKHLTLQWQQKKKKKRGKNRFAEEPVL